MRRHIKRFFEVNLLLKFISLLIAIIVWVYIIGELGKGALEQQELVEQVLPMYRTIVKDLPIVPRIIGRPRRHYRIIDDKITVVPGHCVVVGPKRILESIQHITTVPIDVSDVSETITRQIPLSRIGLGIYSEETVVMVTIPIEKE